MNSNKYNILILISITIILSGINFFFGFSQDFDGYLILNSANHLKNTGEYVQSRTFGFPLYEVYIYPVINILNIHCALIFSLIYYILSVIIFYKIIIILTNNNIKSLLFAIIFAVNPFMIISGNSLMETSQGILLALLAIYFFIKHNNLFIYSVIFLILATLTRPDYIILSFCMFLTKIIHEKKITLNIILLGIIYLIFSIVPYELIYTNWQVPLKIINSQNIINKLFKVILGYITLLGIPFFLFIIIKFNKIKSLFNLNNVIFILFVLSFICYTIRFQMLPDEVEYILILFPLLLINISLINLNIRELKYIIILVSLPNILQIYFFKRTQNGELKTQIGITNGAIYQDRIMRLRNEYLTKHINIDIKKIAYKLNIKNYKVGPSTEKNITIFCSFEDLRFYFKGREDPLFYKNLKTQRIYAFPMSTSNGWKQFIYLEKFKPLQYNNIKLIKSIEPLILQKI